jgi:uncharacterized lipoprotein YmbA
MPGSRARRVLLSAGTALAVVALAACAAPPVTLYTLGQAPVAGPEIPLTSGAVVIDVARVTLPDDLDTQDILIRRGSTLESSHRGRWASRLSLGATDLLTARLAQSRPDALVTDEPQTGAISYRLLIDISRLDVAADAVATQGSAVLEADWVIVPRDPAIRTRRGRVRLVVAGPIGTDQDVVALERKVLGQLAGSIDIALLR